MPLLACPKCATNLRVPDGSAAAVRCPKCKTVFTPPSPQPAFEVVDESAPPPPPARPAPRPAAAPAPKSTVRPAPKPAEPEPEFEVIDEEPAPRKRSRRDDDDDDDDDRPRGRRRDRDDDDDDRPRGRGRRRRRDVWDDYDAYDRAVPFRRGKLACLLLSISIWLYMGALGIMTLFILLGWAGASISPNLFVIPGLAGVANWIVALVGLAFAVTGPRQGKGLAIGAVSVAGVHFVLLIVCFTQLQGGSRGLGMMSLGGIEWGAMVTMIPVVDLLIPGLIYSSGSIGTEAIFAVLTGGCEIARLIVMLLMIQAFARAARSGRAEDKAGNGVMVVSVACGAVALIATIMIVIVIEGKLASSAMTLGGLTAVGSYTAYTLMLILPGMAAVETKDALNRRA